MKNLPNAATGTLDDGVSPAMFPKAVCARQLMIGTMRLRRSTPPVVVSTPLTPLALAQLGAPFSVWKLPAGFLTPWVSAWPLLAQPLFPDQSSTPPAAAPCAISYR